MKNNNYKAIVESLFKLKRKIATAVFTIKLENETHIPDLMTRMRILPGVAVVGQKEKVARYMDGDAMLIASLKYLPRTPEIYSGLKHVAVMIKNLPGVKSISVVSYNKKNITMKGEKIVF